MTFKEYVDNPTGTKTAVISYRKMYEDLYSNKWKNIMMREVGKIDYTLYIHRNDYYCHLKIPSENIEKFYYDVVIKMTMNGKQHSLANCPTQFFSNDPSFNYTFAYTFKKNKMTIKDLEEKMSKESLSKPAVVKNPQNTIGYVKTFYFAYIVMNEKGLFSPALYSNNAKKYDKKILLSNIMKTEDKIREREEATKKNKKDNGTGDSLIDDFLDAEVNGTAKQGPNVIKKASKVNMTKVSSKTSSVKKTKTIRKVGRR